MLNRSLGCHIPSFTCWDSSAHPISFLPQILRSIFDPRYQAVGSNSSKLHHQYLLRPRLHRRSSCRDEIPIRRRRNWDTQENSNHLKCARQHGQMQQQPNPKTILSKAPITVLQTLRSLVTEPHIKCRNVCNQYSLTFISAIPFQTVPFEQTSTYIYIH